MKKCATEKCNVEVGKRRVYCGECARKRKLEAMRRNAQNRRDSKIKKQPTIDPKWLVRGSI